MYADDTSVITTESLDKSETKVIRFAIVYKLVNSLITKWDKIVVIKFSSTIQQFPLNISYVKSHNSTKFLGLNLDRTLSVKQENHRICKKLGKSTVEAERFFVM